MDSQNPIVRSLETIREDIDRTDDLLREVLMRRLDLSEEVFRAKEKAGGVIRIYREDRERQILERLGSQVTQERRSGYLAVLRKVLECSRALQYARLCERHPELLEDIPRERKGTGPENGVRFRLTVQKQAGGLPAVLGIIRDQGMEIRQIVRTGEDGEKETCEVTLAGDPEDTAIQPLLLQLSMECSGFLLYE